MSDLNKLKHSITLIDQGKLLEWKGLGKEWNRNNLEKLYKGKTISQDCMLGTATSDIQIPLAHQPHPLTCYLNGQDEVIFIKMEDVKLHDAWADLSETMGQPEKKNTNLPNNHIYSITTEYIYAQKGITLYVVELPPPNKSFVSVVVLYSPTTPQIYTNELGGNATVRFFPLRD